MNKQKYPIEWNVRPVDIKSGWKNNAKVLSEIVTALNNEYYVDDESNKMEEIDALLEILKRKYFNGFPNFSKIERIIVVVAKRWGKDHPGSTVGIIGQDAIDICAEYGIDYENY